MRFMIAPVIAIALATSVQAQDAIEWSEKRRLTFTDFKKVPDPLPSAQQIISRYGVQTELDSTKLASLKTFNGQVTAFFYPNDSWLHETNKTGLQYSNTIFDIYEWACRKFRKRLAENRDLVLTGKIQELSDEINLEFQTILEAYDAESKYASNMLEQMKWESRISQELYTLAAYCKSCTEQKVN